MTKDVIVTISGLQFAQETETEPDEIVTAGSYYKKNGKHYIIYDEVMEGFEGSTKNITYYNTPFGNLFIGIDAEKIQVEESEENINVNVAYALEANYEHLADCRIQMNIKSKDARDFKLQA